MKLFIKIMVNVSTQRFIRHMELRRDENDYLVTLDTCYPIIDLNKIYIDNLDADKVKYPKPIKHQPNKWKLDDFDFMEKLSKMESEVKEDLKIKALEKKLGKKLQKIEL